MAITYLQAINRVLVRLRKPAITTLSGLSEYNRLVTNFIYEAKDEVESSWDWNCLLTSESLSIVAGTGEYTLTGWGEEFSIEMVYDETHNCVIPGPTDFVSITAGLGTSVVTGPRTWAMSGVDVNTGDPQITFYPTPAESQTFTVHGRVKTGLLLTEQDLIYVPWKPVVLLAQAMSVDERGEEGGTPFDELYQRYQRALSTAIARDANLGHKVKDWRVE